MICWYCHWGWASPVVEVYRQSLARLGGDAHPLHYGPAHIVWEDENFGDDSIRYCLDECGDSKHLARFGPAVLSVIRDSLSRLQAIPEVVRCCEPDDYDGEHPERFPPPSGVEMEKPRCPPPQGQPRTSPAPRENPVPNDRPLSPRALAVLAVMREYPRLASSPATIARVLNFAGPCPWCPVLPPKPSGPCASVPVASRRRVAGLLRQLLRRGLVERFAWKPGRYSYSVAGLLQSLGVTPARESPPPL